MILQNRQIKIALLTSIVSYLAGCALFYLVWYKNGQFLHVMIIALIVAGATCTGWLFKMYNPLMIKSKSGKTIIVMFIILMLFGFGGVVNVLEKKRINSIFQEGPNTQVVATVVEVDLRSTRSGKQPWSIIKYDAKNKVVEQSFADTSKNLAIGQKYLIEYSVKYPDMFRVLKKLE